MKVTFVTSHPDATVIVSNMDADSVMAILEEFTEQTAPVMHISLDESAETYIQTSHIIRIDVDQ